MIELASAVEVFGSRWNGCLRQCWRRCEWRCCVDDIIRVHVLTLSHSSIPTDSGSVISDDPKNLECVDNPPWPRHRLERRYVILWNDIDIVHRPFLDLSGVAARLGSGSHYPLRVACDATVPCHQPFWWGGFGSNTWYTTVFIAFLLPWSSRFQEACGCSWQVIGESKYGISKRITDS